MLLYTNSTKSTAAQVCADNNAEWPEPEHRPGTGLRDSHNHISSQKDPGGVCCYSHSRFTDKELTHKLF